MPRRAIAAVTVSAGPLDVALLLSAEQPANVPGLALYKASNCAIPPTTKRSGRRG